MGEYAALPELVAAAEPARIVLAWLDRPVPVPLNLNGAVDSLTLAEARNSASRRLGDGYGLPTAILIDGNGRTCRVWRRPVQADELREAIQHCGVAETLPLNPSL